MKLEKQNRVLSKKEARDDLMEFEEIILGVEGSFKGDNVSCPLKHSFSDDMYVREIFIPEGTLISGKIHKHSHPNFLMKGKVKVVTEKGVETLEAPLAMISEAGTKRALHALTDLVWVTVHQNLSNTRDLEELEQEIIAPSYESYENYIENKTGFMSKIKHSIIKRLIS